MVFWSFLSYISICLITFIFKFSSSKAIFEEDDLSKFYDVLNLGQTEFLKDLVLEEEIKDSKTLKKDNLFSLLSEKKKRYQKGEFNAFSYAEKIIRAGFEFEEHKVLTSDGYINTVWRIPSLKSEVDKKKKKLPIILQHGLLDDSWTFFAFEPKFCLPFILAELGFDIWLPNTRGNIFSWEHIDPGRNSQILFSDYWDFSLDEIAKYDFTANVDFVRSKTGFDKIYYLGHSQGSMQYFLSYMHDSSFIKSKISRFIALGTVPTIYNQYSPIITFFSNINIFRILDTLHMRNFLELNTWSDEVIHFLCSKQRFICKKAIEAFVQTKITNRTDYNEISDVFYYEPGGTSIKNILHWIQVYHNQDLAYYDYGKNKNLKVYNQTKPPSYNMSNFFDYYVPSLITRSDSDPLASAKDVDLWLDYAQFERKRDIIHVINLTNYNHLDYLWSQDAYEDVFKKVAEFINEE